MRQLVRAPLQLAIGQLRVVVHQRHRLRRARRLLLEQLVQALVLRILRRRRVPLLDQLMTLRRAQQRQARDSRAPGPPRSPPAEPRSDRASRSIGSRVEQVGRVLEDRRASPPSVSVQRTASDRTSTSPISTSHAVEASDRGSSTASSGVFCRTQTSPGTAAGGSGRAGLQLLHQLLERHVLMRIRPQRQLPHPLQQARGTVGSPGQVRPQHQRVDEEADQPFQLAMRAARDRRADHDVVLPAVALQQT